MTVSSWVGSLLLGALALGLGAVGESSADTGAHAELRGHVSTATSRWTASGDDIVTDLVIVGSDGSPVSITILGGSVDGIGMSFSHHDASFRAGDDVLLVPQAQGMRAQRIGSAAAPRIAPLGEVPRVGVQRTSKSQRALFHTSGCIDFVYDDRGTNKLPGTTEWNAVDDALAGWETASMRLSCGGVKFGREAMTNPPDGRDGINTIRFRDDRWCRPESLGTPEVCHSPQAAGVTRVLFVDDPASSRDGEIIEVDIELNGVDFALATDGRAGAVDLASVVAHEVGHALGLDHNCGVENGAWPTGLDGTLVGSCESLPAELIDATMYFQVAPGTVTMRTPQASDLEDLCEITLGLCSVEVDGGCSTGGTTNPLPVFGAVLVGALVAGRRRRRR